MAPELESQAELFTPLYEHAMAWLTKRQTEPGLIVDAGSGPGVVACLLADTFPGAHLDADDRATLDRLLDPDDKASVYHRPDVFVLVAQTVYTAVRVK